MSVLSKIVGIFSAILGVLLGVLSAFGGLITRLLAKVDAFVPFGQLSGKILAVVIGLLTSALVGGLLTLVGIGLDNQAVVDVGGFTTVIAGVASVVAVVLFLITWPLDQRGAIEAVIVKSGIRQRSRTSTSIIAALLGVAIAVTAALLIGYGFALLAGESTALSALNRRLLGFTFVVVWICSTIGLLLAFQKKNKSYIRTDLTIVDIHDHERADGDEDASDGDDPDGDGDESEDRAHVGARELVVRNDSDDLVDFWKAKIEDTNQNYYRLDVDMRLRPGETGTFELPPGFSLETATYELPLGLDLFYDDTKVVSIYARSGDTFVLEWDETEDPTKVRPVHSD